MKEQEISSVLRDLASELGVTAEKLWGVLVAYAPINATLSLVFVLACWWFLLWLASKAIKYEGIDDYGNWSEVKVALVVALIGASMVTVFITIIGLSEAVPGFFAPEYWAFREILRAIR